MLRKQKGQKLNLKGRRREISNKQLKRKIAQKLKRRRTKIRKEARYRCSNMQAEK